jgi:GDP-L-fucose synthase
LCLGSSCIYPKFSEQPIKESSLLTGSLEPTNEWIAVAKIAGIKLIQAYQKQFGHNWISAMPTNIYGPGDNYDLDNSHVLPALIRKFHEAKIAKSSEVIVWGTGAPLREFMHSSDLADALIFVVDYNAKITWDVSKPDGTPRKLMDSSKLQNLGWQSKKSLHDGIMCTYENWKKEISQV